MIMNNHIIEGLNYFEVEDEIKEKVKELCLENGYEMHTVMKSCNHKEDQWL